MKGEFMDKGFVLQCPNKFNPHAVIALNKEGEIVFRNVRAGEILKKLKIESEPKNFLPEDISQIVKDVQKRKNLLIKRDICIKDLVFAESIFFDDKSNLTIIYADDITIKRKIENDLLEKKRRYKELVEFLPQAVFEMNVSGIITFANQTAVNFFNLTKADIKKKVNVFDLIIPEDRKRAMENLRKTIKHKKDRNEGHEYTALRKNGSTFSTLVYTSKIRKNKKIIGIRGIALNIAEKKKTEDKLKKSEEKYRKIFEDATEGIFQTTPAGRYLNINPAFAKMLGFSSSEEVMDKISDIGKQLYVNPKDRERLKKLLLKRGSVRNFEAELYKKNKDKIWISISCHAVKNRKGEILYMEGTNQDITKRKIVEKVLKESEEKYKSLVEKTKDIIYSVNRRGIITFVNDSVKSVAGFSPNEIIGKPFSNFIHPDDLTTCEYMFKTGNNHPYEIRIITKKGDVRWVRNHGGAFPPRSRKEKETQGIVVDITERKKTENQLIDSYKHLGFFNRQISILSKLNEIDDFGGIQHILNSILVSSTELFGADASLLYKCKKENESCVLLSFIGVSKKQTKAIKNSLSRKSAIAGALCKNKSQIFGTTEYYEMGNVTGLKNLKYLHAIPIMKNNEIEAFILMFLEKRKDILHMDFFSEIFSFQVRLILENLKII